MRLVALVVACCGLSAVAQTQLAFEVASIRPSSRSRPAPLPSSLNQLVRAGYTLRQLVISAFGRDEYTVFGGADWVRSARFDVTAKAERAVTRVEMREMTRRLLEERFALKTHTETREIDVFVLELARSDGRLGPQLKPSSLDCRPFLTGARPMAESPKNECGVSVCSLIGAVWGARGTGWNRQGIGLDQIVTEVQGIVGRLVLDRTGLSGTFDVDLRFTPDGRQEVPSGYPPLMTALVQQLGLKLESRKERLPVLVIDDARLPTPN